jgi:hypothetical protein
MPKIIRVDRAIGNNFEGAFFVSGIVDSGSGAMMDTYLHTDGTWQDSTYSFDTEEWTGYFETREDADAALAAYLAKGE